MGLVTSRIPVSSTQCIAHSVQELLGWRSHQSNHLGEVSLIVEMAIFICRKQIAVFEEIPDLKVRINMTGQSLKGSRIIDMGTYHDAHCPDIYLRISLHTRDNLRRSIYTRHDVAAVFLIWFT